jgi:aspartate kinase
VIVMKFGGTSVQDAAALRRFQSIVAREEARRPLVVVSALAGVTNGLLEAARLSEDGELERAEAEFEALAERHRALAGEMSVRSEQAGLFGELEALFETGRGTLRHLADPGRNPGLTDALLAVGELASSTIAAAVLRANGQDAIAVDIRPMMVTGEDFGRAPVLLSLAEGRMREGLPPLLAGGAVGVTQGFIGSTVDGRTTTLGRGGSDYSAALIGAALDADEIQIWTDVDGVMTTDPRIVPQAKPLEAISFSEAAELAYFGAKVLHPSTLRPAMLKDIPVRVLNARNPDGPGTTIVRDAAPPPAGVRAIALKKGITVVQVTSDRMLMAHGFLARLFDVFSRHRTPVDMVSTSEVSVSMTLDDVRHLEAIRSELTTFGDVTIERDQAIVCLVGDGLKGAPGCVARVFQAVREVPVSMISHGASAINVSFVVPGSTVEDAVRVLHREFFEAPDAGGGGRR